MKLLKVLFTLILLSSSVAASATDPVVLQVVNEDVTITEWHVHLVNNRNDSGNMIVACDAGSEETLLSGSTRKCSGLSSIYAKNSAYYVPVNPADGTTGAYGLYSHSMSSCKNFENLLTVTGTGDFLTGTMDDVCSQDLTLDGISEN